MKILVVGDSHGNISNILKVLKKWKDINLIIHLGDFTRDARRLSAVFPKIPVEYICGNCDYAPGDTPLEKMLELEGKRIFMTHGHKYSVKRGYDDIEKKAAEAGADLAVFGHTHIAEYLAKNGLALLNPGSISSPRQDSAATYAVVEILDGRLSADIYSL